MKNFIFKSLVILIISQSNVNALCDVCQKNGVACTSKTTYQPCFGGSKAHVKQTFNCTEGFECTELPTICFQSGGWTPSCGDLSKCSVCDSKNVFACTGQATFAFCFGSAVPTNVRGTCPGGLFCDLTSSSICVPHDDNAEFSCDTKI